MDYEDKLETMLEFSHDDEQRYKILILFDELISLENVRDLSEKYKFWYEEYKRLQKLNFYINKEKLDNINKILVEITGCEVLINEYKYDIENVIEIGYECAKQEYSMDVVAKAMAIKNDTKLMQTYKILVEESKQNIKILEEKLDDYILDFVRN